METPLDVLSRAASLVHADDEKRTYFNTSSMCLEMLESERWTTSLLPPASSYAVPPVAQVLPTRCHTFWSDCNSFSRWQSRSFGERKCLWCNVAILSFVYAGRQIWRYFFSGSK